jgi:hypothetical protein
MNNRMRLVKAREMERIDHFAIEPIDSNEIDRTLEEMWHSGRSSRESRLCVLRRDDGVYVNDAVRRFAKWVCRRLPSARMEDASLASIVQLASHGIYRPIVVVRTQSPCTPKSVLRAAAEAMGTLHHPSMTLAKACAMVLAAADHYQTRIIIFDNLPHNLESCEGDVGAGLAFPC